MKFRPCIDLHEGKVKQIVGSTLKDTPSTSDDSKSNDVVSINFETTKPASHYATMYAQDQLTGGHIIMLGPGNTNAARSALQATPGILQIGGGITIANAEEWIQQGASHVIITSYLFSPEKGTILYDRLEELVLTIGKDKLVIDLSCRKKPKIQTQQDMSSTSNTDNNNSDDYYYVVTDRWQTFTNVPITPETLQKLSQYCDEFLIHGVDVEGKQCGILEDLVALLGKHSPIPVTYAGGVRSIQDLQLVKQLGNNVVDCTVGSALDIFGGTLSYRDVIAWHNEQNPL